MPEIPFVDAHVHLWDLSRLHYPWLTPPFADDGPNGSVEAIARTYLLDDYLADAARWNVVGMVHIDAGAEASAALAETEWLQAMRDARGMPSGIVAFAALDDPDVDVLLAAHARHGGVRGIRHIVNWHADPMRTYTPRDMTQDEAWRRGYARLAHHGLSFDLQCYPGQMGSLAALVARHPDVPVIVNHMGMAVASDPAGFDDWRQGMRALAANAHVVTKISGVGFIDRRWTIEQIRPLVLEAIEMFGADRCLFASDVPTDKLFGSFDRHMEAYHAIVADFSDAEKRALFGGNANRVYRLGIAL
ncbi:putative TIM-barrel fold metal-dependent hydrolase [Hephaestia caeni]|uniref:Putative TIM-barrel fold metal-dependent hydrolase n=1 Tax=Hephaestia caeni TaxID=645617 RepID=A0A397P2G9_9SPHN|nr:amidohydrolase family protein [Hephaestia caeni]RIA43776.1 putative TIM-barrel fold metal-dependent hydrolase [Hephaestia caeni]